MDFNQKIIKTRGGLDIFTESIGKPTDPSILLIMGAMNQGIFWYDSFCKELSENGFFVIRYDHRDTGFSSVIDCKNHPYNLNDLTDDAIDILNAHNVSACHVIGISMGGYIGQLLAANHEDLVKTLTLISTSADHRPYMDATTGNFNNKYELSYPNKLFLNYLEQAKNNPPKNEDDFRNSQIEGWKIMFGKNLTPSDLEEIIKLIDVSNRRNKNKYSPFNHGLAVINSEDRIELVKKIKIPTFIFHGESDVCLPLDHGKLLNKNIPDSKLKIIKDMGHMFSPSESVHLLSNILDNIKSS